MKQGGTTSKQRNGRKSLKNGLPEGVLATLGIGKKETFAKAAERSLRRIDRAKKSVTEGQPTHLTEQSAERTMSNESQRLQMLFEAQQYMKGEDMGNTQYMEKGGTIRKPRKTTTGKPATSRKSTTAKGTGRKPAAKGKGKPTTGKTRTSRAGATTQRNLPVKYEKPGLPATTQRNLPEVRGNRLPARVPGKPLRTIEYTPRAMRFDALGYTLFGGNQILDPYDERGHQ
jgi:hypothetical protein